MKRCMENNKAEVTKKGKPPESCNINKNICKVTCIKTLMREKLND